MCSPILCSICREEFNTKDSDIVIIKHHSDKNLSISRLRGHYFHRSCIYEWRKHSGTKFCPLDRECIRSLYHVPSHLLCGLDLCNYDNFYELYNKIKINNSTLKVINNINKRDFSGRTLIYCACQNNNLQLVKKLVKTGADPSIPNFNGFTPLMISISNNQRPMTQYLLKLKPVLEDLNAIDNKGWTALEYAVSKCRLNAVTLLLNTERIKLSIIRNLISIYSKPLKKQLFGESIINDLFLYLRLYE